HLWEVAGHLQGGTHRPWRSDGSRRLSDCPCGSKPRHTEAEGRVRQFGFGIWGSTFEKPADWRTAHPQERPKVEQVAAKASTSQASARPRIWRDDLGRCAIKGNHSRHGDWIYHMPGQAYYHQTRPEA